MIETYFTHCRTAIKVGLKNIIKEKDEVLIPDFICESVLQPFKQLKIKYRFYNINIDLSIDWVSLNNNLTENTKALLFVNYFGFPNELDELLKFCKKNKIYAIEDNAHGYMGKYKGKLLGSFGDIGVSSPRKHLDILNGGVLYSNKKLKYNLNRKKIKFHENSIFCLKYYLKKSPTLLYTIKKLILNRPKYEIQDSFKEKEIEDLLIDKNSLKKILKCNLNEIIKLNANNFLKWKNFALENKLTPLINKNPNNLNPWCFPIIVKDQSDQIRWFDWGWKNNVSVFSWPTLPSEFNRQSNVYKNWGKIVCFTTKKFI